MTAMSEPGVTRPGEAAAVEAAVRMQDNRVQRQSVAEIAEIIDCAYPFIAAVVRAEERERIVVNLAEAVQSLMFGQVDAATSALTGHDCIGCARLRCDNVRAVLAPLADSAARLAREEPTE